MILICIIIEWCACKLIERSCFNNIAILFKQSCLNNITYIAFHTRPALAWFSKHFLIIIFFYVYSTFLAISIIVCCKTKTLKSRTRNVHIKWEYLRKQTYWRSYGKMYDPRINPFHSCKKIYFQNKITLLVPFYNLHYFIFVYKI